MTAGQDTYFRKGFGLKAEVQGELEAAYAGRVVEALRANDFSLTVGEVSIRMAREFGFCYGVERAVEYAYQARRKFPDRRIFLLGEIIHNPHVNERLRSMGITIMLPIDSHGTDARFDYRSVGSEDVVILPAFGVTIRDFEMLRDLGCVVVDTTCGSVLNVWKRVEGYARDGLTSLIHGKHYHEETRATASQVQRHPGGQFLVVRDMTEAREVCTYIRALGRGAVDESLQVAFMQKFARAAGPGFSPERHLRRIGVANQTTMLARESLAIGEEVGRALEDAFGIEWRREHFRTFDTICSATQDRQDAVNALLQEPLDVMVVIGGFNSSNTISLATICAEKVPTYHVEDAGDIDVAGKRIHYRAAGVQHREATAVDWLPAQGPVLVGVTAGASTPNNRIGDTVVRILATRGLALDV